MNYGKFNHKKLNIRFQYFFLYLGQNNNARVGHIALSLNKL